MSDTTSDTPEKQERLKSRPAVPRLSELQIAAITERKNTVNGRYVATRNARRALLKMYPQLDGSPDGKQLQQSEVTAPAPKPVYIPAPEVEPPAMPPQPLSAQPSSHTVEIAPVAAEAADSADLRLQEARLAVERSYFNDVPDLPEQLAELKLKSQSVDGQLPDTRREAA